MRQALGPGALGGPGGSGWGGRWEGESGWGRHVNPKAFSFQCMTKFTTNKKKKERERKEVNKYSGPKGLKLGENDTALFWLTKLCVCVCVCVCVC